MCLVRASPLRRHGVDPAEGPMTCPIPNTSRAAPPPISSWRAPHRRAPRPLSVPIAAPTPNRARPADTIVMIRAARPEPKGREARR